MDPNLILFGIQSIIRLGRTGKDALEQHYRDDGALFPDLLKIKQSPENHLTLFFREPAHHPYVSGENAPYAHHWDPVKNRIKPHGVDALLVLATKIKGGPGTPGAQAGITLVRQWDPQKGPIGPLARVVLAAGDIALEYVGTNPSLLGGDGKGEKLLGAFAENLGQFLPENGHYGPKEGFGERVLTTFLKAGFTTLHAHPDWVVSQAHVQELMAQTLSPLMAAFPQESILEQMNYQALADALMGPAAEAAMEALAQHPHAFFGKKFEAATPMGELTRALLKEAARDGLVDEFTREGIIRLYRAALGVAMAHPELFAPHGGKATAPICRELISGCARKLQSTPFPYDGALGLQLAGTMMEVISQNAPHFIPSNRAWEEWVAEMVQKIAGDLGTAFETNAPLKTIFTQAQLMDLGRIPLEEMAKIPGENQVHREVIKAVAAAMAADTHLLLTGEDWKKILAVAARAAAQNPNRLFNIKEGEASPGAQLLSESLKAVSPSPHAVFFGPTLARALILIIEKTAGRVQGAMAHQGGIVTALEEVNDFVARHPDQFGSKEGLQLFNIHLESILANRAPPALTPKTAVQLLAQVHGGEK